MAYKFQCGLSNESYSRECVRHFAVRSGEHIGISSLTTKRAQPRKDSAVCHYLLNCNYSPTFEDFSVLCHENKKYLLELKESLLIMRDRQSMNRTLRCARLYLFEWALATFCCALWISVISFLLISRKLKHLDFNYQYVKWLDKKQSLSVRNVSPIIFKKWICCKKLFSLH